MPAVFDDGPEFFSLVMFGPDPQQRIEIGVEFARVAVQCAVGEIWPSSGDGTGALEEFAKSRREGRIAGIDSIFGVADEMGETKLMVVLGPTHLGAETVRDPEVRTIFAKEFRHHDFAAVWVDDKAARIAMVEHPGPPVSLADARTGLVGGQNGAGKKFGADAAALFGEGFLALGQHLDE